jgi:hypothetical protein
MIKYGFEANKIIETITENFDALIEEYATAKILTAHSESMFKDGRLRLTNGEKGK